MCFSDCFAVLIRPHPHEPTFKPAVCCSINIVSVLYPAKTFCTFELFLRVSLRVLQDIRGSSCTSMMMAPTVPLGRVTALETPGQ